MKKEICEASKQFVRYYEVVFFLNKSVRLHSSYNCGNKGHQARARTQTQNGPKCFACQTYGHKASECVKNNRVVSTKINVMEDYSLVDVEVNGVAVRALFDSGSRRNTIYISRLLKVVFLITKRTLKAKT